MGAAGATLERGSMVTLLRYLDVVLLAVGAVGACLAHKRRTERRDQIARD